MAKGLKNKRHFSSWQALIIATNYSSNESVWGVSNHAKSKSIWYKFGFERGQITVLPDARDHIRILIPPRTFSNIVNRKYFATENTSLKKEQNPKAVPGAT